jgi:hypothetical protein
VKPTGSPIRPLAALALATALATTSGCLLIAVGAAGAAGAGTVAYVRGELDANLGSQYEEVINAANAAVSQLQLAKVRESKDAFSAEIIARNSADKKINITISKKADSLTKLAIRIGLFGDEEESRAILDTIRTNLPS